MRPAPALESSVFSGAGKVTSLIDYDPGVRDEFLNDLHRDDEVGMILRAHIHIEHAIIEILEAHAANNKLISKARLDYSRKITIAAAFDAIRMSLLEPLKKIGTLRNKFAHELGYKITPKDIELFINSFSKEDREILETTYAKIQVKSLGDRPKSFKDLQAKDKFILGAVALRQALIAELRRSPT